MHVQRPSQHRSQYSYSHSRQTKTATATADAQTALPAKPHLRTLTGNGTGIRNSTSRPSDTSTPAISRLPSAISLNSLKLPTSPRRRATNPSSASTPSLTQLNQLNQASAASSSAEPRSPTNRRPPASFSGHGIDTSCGPPITLITRGNSDLARQPSQKHFSHPTFFTSTTATQTQTQTQTPSRDSRGRAPFRDAAVDHDHPQPNTPARQTSSTFASTQRPMATNADASSGYDSAVRSQFDASRAVSRGRRATTTSVADGTEDLFLNIAADSANNSGNANKNTPPDSASRTDRLKSRIARASQRQSFPSTLHSTQPSAATTNGTRIPAAIDTKAATPLRRGSLLPSRTPLTPGNGNPSDMSTPRQDLSPKTSFSSRKKDSDLSPSDFLASLEMSKRRPSYTDATHTPPHRASTYRPSNLYYSSSRETPHTPNVPTSQEMVVATRAAETESHGSTGPATSVWDELDELKTRIRRIEMGGKVPATANAVMAQASAERPRTANTSITTVSSSPNQQRKPAASPSELSTVGISTPNKVHPLLGEALAKAKQHVSPAVYRVLEATAAEALALAEMTGSAGPQGTLSSASTIINGASIPDRQIRRKADSLCRSLTELCIALCDAKPSLSSPAFRSITAPRRSSLQTNGDSPSARHSIGGESIAHSTSSPSTAMSRIEARRASMMAGSAYGSPRETSVDPPTPSQQHIPSRISRANTSLTKSRQPAEDEDDDPTLRAPSRALTDFRDIRSAHKPRYSREYTSREPLPESNTPTTTTPMRRPTAPLLTNDTNSPYRDMASKRYGAGRQIAFSFDSQASESTPSRMPFASNRNSTGGLGRSGSLKRTLRGKTAAE